MFGWRVGCDGSVGGASIFLGGVLSPLFRMQFREGSLVEAEMVENLPEWEPDSVDVGPMTEIVATALVQDHRVGCRDVPQAM